MKISIPGIQNVLNGLAAAAACLCLNEPPEHIAEGLARYLGMKGRFMVMPLTGGVTLVDDTYNSNPLSLKAALDSMGVFIGERSRIIVGLGEMMELGDAAVSAHREAGQMVANLGASHFFAIGEHTNEMIKGAVVAGMPLKQTEAVKTHKEMAKRIRELMREGDIIFLKGSRKMTLEKVVEDLKDHIETRGEMT
jgi:UDP-N-acetylmuramyl pentapeptide synthase